MTMRYITSLALVVSLILPRLVSAQTIFQCSIDSSRMLIGDQRTISLAVQSSVPIIVDSVDFRSWNELGIEVLEGQQWPVESGTSISTQLRIGVFDTGYIKLPPLPAYINHSGGGDTIFSNDLALEVSGILIDSTGLAPIKPILKEPLAFRDFIPYLIALAVGCAIIGLIFLRKKKTAPAPSVVVIPDPPHEIALRDLEDLEKKKLWQQGQIKSYQSELTHIIRAYLEGRFKIPALESTTSEVLSDLESKEVDPDLRQDLDQILNMADLIKFAKAKPDIDIHTVFMQKAEKFVLSTKEETNLNFDDD